MTSTYVAKYPFNGNAAQAQLSFPAGAHIVARNGQEGKPWYWGNYMGKDGWFPPTYVTKVTAPAAPTPTMASASQSMQQQMAGASFTSSVQQKQTTTRSGFVGQNQGGFGGGMQQQQQQQQTQQQQAVMSGFGITDTSGLGGFKTGADDPFAALASGPASSAAPSLGSSTHSGPGSTAGTAPVRSSSNHSVGAGTVSSINANTAPTSVLPSSAANATNGGSTNSSSMMANPFKSGMSFAKSTKSSTGSAASASASTSKTPDLSQIFSSGNTNASANGNTGVGAVSRSASVSSPTPQMAFSSQPVPQQQQVGASPVKQVQSAASSMMGKVSAAFANVNISAEKTAGEEGGGVETSLNDETPVLKQDQSQKKMIEEQLARKKAEEEARIQREAEERWERDMQAEKERRLAAAAASATHQSVSVGAPTPVALPSPRAEGLGASGSAISANMNIQTGGAVGGPPVLHPNMKKGPFFDPYAYLSDARPEPTRKFNPIYRVQPFWELLNISTYVRKLPPSAETQTVAGKYDQLAKAMSFICHIVQENERFHGGSSGMDAPLSYLKANQLGMEACVKMIAALPHSAGASGVKLDTLFLNFINMFVGVVNKIQPHQQIVIPGGWQQLEGKGNICLYILRNHGGDKFSFTVVNTGQGLEYHPSSFNQSSGLELKQIAMTIWDIPAVRLTDSSFWVLLFRMQVYPDKKNTAEFLYTKLLPALNSRPLRSNLDLGPSEFLEVPDKITRANFHFLAKITLTTIPAIGGRPSKYSSLLLMNAAVDLAYKSIQNAPPGSMDPEDTRILKLAGRNLANFGSSLDVNTVSDGSLGPALSSSWDLLDNLLKKLNFSSSKPMDQHSHGMPESALTDSFSKGTVTSLRVEPGLACHPFFGRFRRDNYDAVVKELMGEQRPDPILIPAVLTDESMPSVSTDYQTAASSLQRLCHACSLLLHQRQLVKNAPAFVASAAQYALTVTLPMPHLDPLHCFWRKSPMRRETQTNLLFLIRRMCRIYSAATTCVQQSRGLVAIRTTAFACAACISDAITRVTASDDPSPFSLHYSGDCEGPTEPFGIEAGSFETLAANMPIFDAHYTSLRFLCLDYLRGISIKMDGSSRPTIFNYDKSMIPKKGDIQLIDQLSIELALPRPYPPTKKASTSNASSLISGKNGLLLEVLPEMEYFRDIVFHFKHSVSGKAAAPSDIGDDFTWLPHHATLKWSTKPVSSEDSTPMYKVVAFRGTEQEYVEVVAKSSSSGAFKSFMNFFNKGKEERRKLSAADPTNIVNSCGEKFLKAKYVNLVIIL